ncbi:MAG: sugar ABC transporter substrate-binding protein [Microbacteriaceae bacterium]|nr:MAG: sugar ABC transporter substrate-binding protein [Microbacteriaceae bacterium]
MRSGVVQEGRPFGRRQLLSTVGVAAAGGLLAGCTSSEKGANTAKPAAGAAGMGATWARDIRLYTFGGGPAGDQFGRVVVNGYKQASTDLGCNITTVYSDWDVSKFVSQFREAIAAKPDGIAMMGQPGDEALMPLAQQAEEAGIYVEYCNTDVPKVRAEFGSGYVGADQYNEGLGLGNEAIKEFNLKAGDRAIVFGFFNVPGNAPRDNGVADAFSKAGLNVVKLVLDISSGGNPASQTGVVSGALSKYPDAKVMSLSGGQWVGEASVYLKAAGRKAGDVAVIGFDAIPGVVTMLQQGWAQMVASQQPFLQGYLPVLNLCMRKRWGGDGFAGLDVDTAHGFITEKNVKPLLPQIRAGIVA